MNFKLRNSNDLIGKALNFFGDEASVVVIKLTFNYYDLIRIQL